MVPLAAPTQRPAEPGPTAAEAGIMDDQELTFQQLGKIAGSLRQIVDLPGSTREARYLVRKLVARR